MSDLVGNPEDPFSHVTAHIIPLKFQTNKTITDCPKFYRPETHELQHEKTNNLGS